MFTILFFLISIWFSYSTEAMQQPVQKRYNARKTTALITLLNRYRLSLPLPKKEITALISAGADPSGKAESGFYRGCTWLDGLLMSGDPMENENLITFLIQRGTVLNDWVSLSPLQKACINGQIKIVKLLIAYGAQVNAKNYVGNSALMFAVAENHPVIVRTLLENGAADVMNDQNTQGQSPLSWAQARKIKLASIVTLLESHKK